MYFYLFAAAKYQKNYDAEHQKCNQQSYPAATHKVNDSKEAFLKVKPIS